MTLMLDNVFGIFNNVPPRINWAELELPFPSADRYFQIANYEEATATRLFPAQKMKIEEAFLILFLPPEASKEKLKVLRDGSLTALDMQLLIHCMSCASLNMLIRMLTYKLLQSSTPTSGHIRLATRSSRSQPPTCTRSSSLSKQRCGAGRRSGTRSDPHLHTRSGRSSGSRGRHSRIAIPWELC